MRDAAYCTQCGGALPCFDIGDVRSAPLPKADSGPRVQAFGEPVTPKIDNKRARIAYAMVAAPIIGLMIGGISAGWLGIGLESIGAPRGTGAACAVLGILAVTALVAYLIISERFAGVTANSPNRERDETYRP